jgi:hypothetical protein
MWRLVASATPTEEDLVSSSSRLVSLVTAFLVLSTLQCLGQATHVAAQGIGAALFDHLEITQAIQRGDDQPSGRAEATGGRRAAAFFPLVRRAGASTAAGADQSWAKPMLDGDEFRPKEPPARVYAGCTSREEDWLDGAAVGPVIVQRFDDQGRLAVEEHDDNVDGVFDSIHLYFTNDQGQGYLTIDDTNADGVPDSVTRATWWGGGVSRMETDVGYDGTIDEITRFMYDRNGFIRVEWYDTNADGAPEEVRRYDYDIDTPMYPVRIWQDFDADGVYDGLDELTWSDGLLREYVFYACGGLYSTLKMYYDVQRRLVMVEDYGAGMSEPADREEYSYGGDGWLQETRKYRGAALYSVTRIWRDEVGRVLRIESPGLLRTHQHESDAGFVRTYQLECP